MPAVLTVDQQDSRTNLDAVPALLDLLGRRADPRPCCARSSARSATRCRRCSTTPTTVVATIARILRTGGWSVGLGLGAVDEPLPPDSRAGRGEAYLHARDAVTRAKTAPHRICVVGADRYRAEQLETVLWLWAGLLERRTDRGWEVHDALGRACPTRRPVVGSASPSRRSPSAPRAPGWSTSAGRVAWPASSCPRCCRETNTKEVRR